MAVAIVQKWNGSARKCKYEKPKDHSERSGLWRWIATSMVAYLQMFCILRCWTLDLIGPEVIYLYREEEQFELPRNLLTHVKGDWKRREMFCFETGVLLLYGFVGCSPLAEKKGKKEVLK